MAALIAGQSEQDNPLAIIAQERRDAVFTHIRGDSERIDVQLLEERARIHGTGVTNVTSLSVSNDEMLWIVGLEILDSLLKSHPSLHAKALVESEVGFIGHAERRSRVNDGLVELKDRVLRRQEVLRDLLYVSVETYTEESLTLLDDINKLLPVHDYDVVI